MTPADFNFEKRTVSINKSYQRLNKQDVITDPKTPKSNRVIQMPKFLCDEIQDYLVGGRTTSMSVSENLTLVYRNDFIETRLGASASYRKAWYEIASQARADTWDNSVFAEVNATMPWGMEFCTDARYNYYIGYEAGYGDPELTWNAEISQLFLKDKMTLRFKVYDILNQSRNNYRTTTDNYVEDTYNNTLGQYFMISLVYRFGNFDKGGFRRGPGGPRPRH